MASHRIVCTVKVPSSHGSQHISAVGTDGGSRMSVAQVREAIDRGDTFYTFEGGSRATVVKFDCDRCGFRTIRSHEDHTVANNLDNLRPC